ncbi:MAG TPA: DUF2997 domain-containing protein [Pirellulales bacterium]|nr:DUF2997 domain-containing protein [Pirellulales bacterium]
MSQIIELTISPAGQTTIRTMGFTGAACQYASRFLEQALGVTTADQKTPEFYHQQGTQLQVRQDT